MLVNSILVWRCFIPGCQLWQDIIGIVLREYLGLNIIGYDSAILVQVLDYLAIGVHELASISERRIERLVNPSLSELPAFLVQDGGLNCGFMIAHCTAAALGVSICVSWRYFGYHTKKLIVIV